MAEVMLGRRPTLEDVEKARERVKELEARYKFVLDESPEAQEALRQARADLAEVERRYEAEQRRVAALKEAMAREKAERERRQQEAVQALKPALVELELQARQYWEAVAAFATRVVSDPEFHRVEDLADKFHEARGKTWRLIQESGEMISTWQPSKPLRELLRVVQSSGPKVEPPNPDVVARVRWLADEVRGIGGRHGFACDLPLGGPSVREGR